MWSKKVTDREKELEKNIMEYSIKVIDEQKKQMSFILEEKQKDIAKDVLWSFHELFQKATGNTVDGKSKEVAYIIISFLNTGIINESIEINIGLYDSNMLFDKEPITRYYNFHFFDEIIKKDMEDFKNYIQSKMIRVKYQELYRYKRVCMIKYKSVMEECMQAYVEMIVHLKSFIAMNTTPDIKILFGELMCKNTILYEGGEEKL